MSEEFHCPICGRLTPKKYQEEHHLIPKCKKGKETVTLCRSCADFLHKIFTIQELNNLYNTIEKIKTSEDIQKWAKWANKKQNDFSICMATKKKR